MKLFENKTRKQNTYIRIPMLIIVFIRIIIAVTETERVTKPKRNK